MEWKVIEKWSLCISLFIIICFLGVQRECKEVNALQKSVAKDVIRFHVLANSDEEEDQQKKLLVRNEVVAYMNEKLNHVQSKSEAEQIIQENMGNIKAIAESTLRENGASQNVKAYMTHCDFPVKTYGNLVLPAGNYETVQIEIGEAKGHNWWCVMYPSLCVVEESIKYEDKSPSQLSEEDREKLEDTLEEGASTQLVNDSEEQNSVTYRFKLVELFNEMTGN